MLKPEQYLCKGEKKMKAVKGYTKESYIENAPKHKEFKNIDLASKYLTTQYPTSLYDAILSILDDTNCDAIFFDDGSVVLIEP